jgi:L-serine deaminase
MYLGSLLHICTELFTVKPIIAQEACYLLDSSDGLVCSPVKESLQTKCISREGE